MSNAIKLKKEFDFYLKNQKDLVKKFDGKFVVFKGDEVIGVYSSKVEAIEETQKSHELGTFLVQLVTAGNTEYTQNFHSRVAFQ